MAHTPFMAKARPAARGTRAQPLAGRAALAYAIGALSVATTLYALVRQRVELGWPDDGYGVDPFQVLMVITFAAAGALIASRRPANPIGWLFLFSAAFGAIGAASSVYLRRELVVDGAALSARGVLRSLYEWGWVPFIVPVVAFVPMFFPDGRLLSTRWRPMPALGLVGAVLIAAAITLSPTDATGKLGSPGSSAFADPNPYAIDAPWVGSMLVVGFALLLVAMVLAVASLLVRMRRGTPTERQQLKVFFSAAILYPASVVPGVLTGSFLGSYLGSFLQLLALLGIVAVPVAVTIAILRYRLYDIDVLIRRTLIYAILSAVLLAAYAAGVGLIQFALSPVTSGNGFAVAISTLAVVALFQPVRRRIQSSVDRRFYRRKYDAALTLDGFAVRLRHEIDLDALRDELIRAVGETLQPAHASLWLRGTR